MATENAPRTPTQGGPWDGEVESLLLDQIDAAVIALDLRGVITHWNAHAERLYGWSREEALGRDASTMGFVRPDAERSDSVMEALRAGESWEGDVELVRRDGTPFLAFVKDAPLRGPDGRMVGFVGVSVDVSERRRVEAELRERNAAMLRAKKLARLESWEWNLQMDRIEYSGVGDEGSDWGPAGFEHFLATRVHSDDRERVRLTVLRAIAEREDYSLDFKGLTRDGATRHVTTIGEVVTDDDGEPLRVWGISQDVTDQREAERALRSSEDARRRLLLQLVTAEDDERRRLAGDIHDDAIQVLHAALLRAEALAELVTEPTQSEAAQRVEDALRLTVRNLRNIVAGVRQPAFDGVDLVQAVEAYLQESMTDWRVSHTVETQMAKEPLPEVRAVLFRIVVEAAVNARKHSGAKTLKVRMDSDDEGVCVRVADDGCGMSDPSDAVGTVGHCGLATMKERAELAGGWLRVESSPGAGTTVEAWIPHLRASAAQGDPAADPERR